MAEHCSQWSSRGGGRASQGSHGTIARIAQARPAIDAIARKFRMATLLAGGCGVLPFVVGRVPFEISDDADADEGREDVPPLVGQDFNLRGRSLPPSACTEARDTKTENQQRGGLGHGRGRRFVVERKRRELRFAPAAAHESEPDPVEVFP